jgi:hypothetical protein
MAAEAACSEGVGTMNKDCFFTMAYKGHYIHSHYDRDLKREVVRYQIMKPDGSFNLYDAKSIHAAKYRISAFHGGK